MAQNSRVRVAVISDVHANLYALEAVLGEIDREPADAIWCLGDTVGYGPRPNECCALVRERADLTLIGNHDLVALGAAGVDASDFNPEAAAASLWTEQQLDDASREFLTGLEPTAEVEGVQLFHGSPRDPVWDYVLTEVIALESLALTTAPLLLVGHTHAATALVLDTDGLEGGLAADGLELQLDRGRWLLNPGSVGQPRDGNPDAAFLELDLDAKSARFRRVAYPVSRTQEEIRERGLPDALAERLAHGV
jgi:diadenosine tetraphosphatase ApaH/serine/threonine PP2A family protein phosphatase